MNSSQLDEFIGQGVIADRPWYRSENQAISDTTALGHPGRYKADPGLVDAVNTALLLSKPLLVTGRPGTGKSELAERIAYEFGLGSVLRFEAQSLSEAQDLFYRFDLVGHMAAVHLASMRSDWSATAAVDPRHAVASPNPTEAPDRRTFIDFGPLGKAIIRSDPGTYRDLLPFAFPNAHAPIESPQRSVVLIDEVDKASRDFPNDLLNGIDRMEFRIREISNRPIAGADKGSGFHPIVIITSNSERDLPAPFLRRCTYYDIPDPDENRLVEIVRARVFPELEDGSSGSALAPLPDLYARLLKFFVAARDGNRYGYTPGTSELIDWTQAAKSAGVPGTSVDSESLHILKRVASAAIKHPNDRQRLIEDLSVSEAFRVAT